MKLTDLHLIIPHRRLIGDVCDITGEDPYLLAAIAMRESRFGYAAPYWPKGTADGWGDGSTEAQPTLGYGYGYFQIDRRFHKGFLNRVDRSDPHEQGLYACSILRDARAWFRRNPAVRTDDLDRRMAVAAYNCGPANVARALAESSPGMPFEEAVDQRTTGKNYSRWVHSFAQDLRSIAPDLFSPESKPLGPAFVPAASTVA